MLTQHAPLILASGSTIRQQMLKGVGLTFSVVPSGVDEDDLKVTLRDAEVPALAIALARAKALAVSKTEPDSYTIGADQICVLNGKIFSKPGSYEMAESHLALLSGQTHQQHCGIVLARGSEVLWEHAAHASLTMRALTPEEIHDYVATDAPLSSCGAYKFEDMGRHLFSNVSGDHDVIQGLALVPLLAELHSRGVISLTQHISR